MPTNQNTIWFARIAAAARTVVNDHGGAVVFVRQDLIDAIKQVDGDLHECPQGLWQHMMVALSHRAGLSTTLYVDEHPDILLIHDSRWHDEESARARFQREGLSADVGVALLGLGIDPQSILVALP